MTLTERAAVAAAIREAISIHSSPTIDRGDGHGNRGQSGYIVWESSMPFVIASVVRALAPAPADQSDAGRDGVIEVVARAFGRNDGDAEFAMEKLRREGYAVIALASAPSETVGRGEDDRQCTCHPDDNPPRPCPRKYALSECRRAVGFLSTADRDAIREALKEAKGEIDDLISYGCPVCSGDCASANPPVIGCPIRLARETIAKITAAIALLGEG